MMERGGPCNRTIRFDLSRFVFFFSSLFFSLSLSSSSSSVLKKSNALASVVSLFLSFESTSRARVNTAPEEEKEEKAIHQNLSHRVLGNSAAVVAPQIHL